MTWDRLITVLLFTLTHLCCLVASFNHGMHQQIHKSLRRRDLSRIFGVEEIAQVPSYEVFSPFLDEFKEFKAADTRKKRTVESNSIAKRKMRKLKLGISAFETLHHLNMTENTALLSPNFKVEVKNKNGTIVKRDVGGNCYFHGNVLGQANSLAAMSTCYNQLRGMFSTDTHHYFIEPVPDYLHHGKNYGEVYEKPHIVFRRSINDVKLSNGKTEGLFQSVLNTAKKDRLIRLERSDQASSSDSSLDNNERYIEALVVVDQKMVNYHGEDAATQFALVVMNNVARLLRDASIGANLIILVLTKIQLHTVDVPGLVINHHARNTLKSFGSWAQLSSDIDDRSEDHFDYAILLTRYNICADKNQPCDTQGLTETGGMCLWPYSASVNEDNGLGLVYTVTHNIGHSLGMNHDGDESSFICPDNEFIMASSPSGEWRENRNHWSRCSRNYLRQFLKKDQARCLLDLPVFTHAVDYEKMDNKPGLLYDINKQCEMQFGTGSKPCNKNIENICLTMSCTNPSNPDKCFLSLYPAADGTKCSEKKFCYHGKCIGSANEMTSVDGVWSSWDDDFQACSRSCGGGIQYRQRRCTNPRPSNGGKYCEGDTRTYRLCNTQKCDNSTIIGSYRSMQCSNLNGRLFGERKFEWEFKPSKIASCELGCFIAQTGHGYNFGNVEDGTNCDQMDEGTFTDKCINGQCTPVGCDKKLGSKAKFDRCGVCDGDGLTCVTGSERSSITEASAAGHGGISDALKSLREMGFDMNRLYGKSTLDISGKKRSDIAKKDEYGWARLKSGCSSSCGGGIETVVAECRRLDDGSPVRDDHCDRQSKPPMLQYPCKEDVCPQVFQTSYWGDCSKTCNGGYKRRNVRCVQKLATGIEYDVDSSLCTGTRPTDTEGCNKEPCPAEWIAQPFGECSTICGAGAQTRDVLCQKTIKDGSLVTLSSDDCRNETKPPMEQRCNVHNPCPGDAGCGGIYTDKRGNFTSPGFPEKYPSDMECVHIIQVPKEQVIRLNFERMNIVSADKECRNDFVKVMDGDCVSRLGESKFCGKTLPPPFVSTTNRLCVKFYSDDSQNDEGFLAKYAAIEKPTQIQDLCNANLTAPDGLISSPNYPEFYPQNEDCNITITTEEKPIKVKFHAFDVGGGESCDNDYVLLSGGEESKKFCGQNIPLEYVSKDNVLNVRFVSSSRQNTQKPGFVATYTTGLSEVSRSHIPKPSKLTVNNHEQQKNKTWQDVSIGGSDQKKDIVAGQHNETLTNATTEKLIGKASFVNSTRPDEIAKEVTETKKTLHNATTAKHQEFVNHTKNSNETSKKATVPFDKVAFIKSTQSDGIDMEVSAKKKNKEHVPTETFIHEPIKETSEAMFVPSKQDDQIDDEVQSVLAPKKKVEMLSKAQQLFIDAMKDDTPKWIPEPAEQTSKSIAKNTKKDDIRSHEIKFKLKKSLPHEISKKTFITKPSVFYHNLDGISGDCPSSLRCIDLLMSYPCTVNGRCGPGLSCCQTNCGYSDTQRMCLPKVTKHCPLQLPYEARHIPCELEADCPLRSTCCLDLGNNKYCRFLAED